MTMAYQIQKQVFRNLVNQKQVLILKNKKNLKRIIYKNCQVSFLIFQHNKKKHQQQHHLAYSVNFKIVLAQIQ